MRPEAAVSIQDLVRLARRRLPRVIFDTIEGGVEDERGLVRNQSAFERYQLLPRHLVDVSVREQETALFGRSYACPFGIAPTGVAGMFRRGAEGMLAKAAANARIPFVMSGASVAPIEKIAAIAPEDTWFQLYAAKDETISFRFIDQALRAGIETLVLTVDTPVLPKRERDMRNGFGLPLRLTIASALEALLHPAFLAEYLAGGGMPTMETWAPYAPARSSPSQVAAFFRTQSPSIQTWRDLEGFRRRWPGRLVVKGIAHPEDADRLVDLGCDGVVVSNHGGKALDRGPAPIEALPGVVAAVRGRVPVMLDSGIRRGSDIVIAHCLGAAFVFVGRATLYGAVAGGQPGAARAVEILRQEIDLTLGLIGCRAFSELGPQMLFREPAAAPAPAQSGTDRQRVRAPVPS